MKTYWKSAVVFLVFGEFLLSAVVLGAKPPSAGQVKAAEARIVSNPAEPVPPPGQRKKIVFREELTIGVVEGDENYMFGNSVQVTADEKGCFYVLDWDRKRIQKYDREGKHLLSIGRQGQGPGEFGNIWEMRFDAKGRIYATDIVNKRVSFFNRETGQYEDAIKIGMDTGAVVLLPGGTYFSSESRREQKGDAVSWTVPFGIFDKDFKMLTELHRQVMDYGTVLNYSNRAQLLAQIMSRSAFTPNLSWSVTEKGWIVLGHPETYEIKIFDFEGRLLSVIKKEEKPRPVSDRHKADDFEGRVTEFLSSNSSDLALKDEVRKFMTYPKYLPAYRRCMAMDNGWLFVVADVLRGISQIDVFDDKGVYIGRFETDVPAQSLVFKNGKAYGVAVIDDYKYVKRYGYELKDY